MRPIGGKRHQRDKKQRRQQIQKPSFPSRPAVLHEHHARDRRRQHDKSCVGVGKEIEHKPYKPHCQKMPQPHALCVQIHSKRTDHKQHSLKRIRMSHPKTVPRLIIRVQRSRTPSIICGDGHCPINSCDRQHKQNRHPCYCSAEHYLQEPPKVDVLTRCDQRHCPHCLVLGIDKV